MPPSSSSSSTADPQTQATLDKIATLLKDPVAGPKLMAIVNSPNTGMAANLANVANIASKQSTPSGQIGAGIGGLAGMGLQALLKKPAAQTQQTGGPGGPNIPGVESQQRAQAGPQDGLTDYSNEDTPLDDYAKGGAVLTRRPVLSTTIVIAPKPKKKPQAKKRAEPKAHKPEPPTPFAKGGHVQSPRGAGCAERGKQFRGIY